MKDRRGAKSLTKEQQDYRSLLLRGGKVRSVKEAKQMPVVVTLEDKINQRFYYLDNCMFWVNEYIDGRIDKARLQSIAKSIQSHAREIEIILLQFSADNKLGE